MSEIAEKLFFRYRPGDHASYSLPTLISLSTYFPKYARFIEKKPKAFIHFLSEIPLCILSYYQNILHMVPDFQDAFEHPSVHIRLLHFNSSPASANLYRELCNLNEVHSATLLASNAISITFKKPFLSNSLFDSDMLITLELNEVNVHYVANDSHQIKENTTYIAESKIAIALMVKNFKQKHRLELCFI